MLLSKEGRTRWARWRVGRNKVGLGTGGEAEWRLYGEWQRFPFGKKEGC